MNSPDTPAGIINVEKVAGKSTVTRCFSKYPIKLIVPNKVGASSKCDAVWIYLLSYGGGIVSGDRVVLQISVGDGCTAALTTQASTKVYKSVDSKCTEQVLEVNVGRNSFLAVIPDPVTCFATARYVQKQVFRVHLDTNLVIVDWITSGRYERGERWEFELYRSTNQIFLEGDEPLFLDSVLLDNKSKTAIAERMQEYNVVAMIIIAGPKLKCLRNQLQEEVKEMMSANFHVPIPNRKPCNGQEPPSIKPYIVASCSTFGPQQMGVVVRVAAVTTEAVYTFLRHHLSSLDLFLGISPYGQCGR